MPFLRSNANSNDFATLADVIDEVKQQYSNKNQYFDNICCILPTSPLLSLDCLEKAFKMLQTLRADSVRPVVRFSYPIQRAVKMRGGRIEMFTPQYQTSRSQDLEPAYHDAGQFYWMKYDAGLRGVEKMAIEISEMQVQDIDTENDWEIAELKYKWLNRIEK